MKIKALKTLIYLVENDCDFGISKVIGVPRSTMWSHIDELESELDVKLIHRKKQNSYFTKEGLSFIPHAQKILQSYEEGLNAIHDEDLDTGRGKIIISTTTAVATSWLLPSIREFYAEHPNLKVVVAASDRLTKKVENTADILLRPYDGEEDFEKIWRITYRHGLFASPKYIEKKGMPKKTEDLLEHSIINYGDEEFSYFDSINWHVKGRDYHLPRLTPNLTINSTGAIYQAAIEGLGICSASIEANSIFKGDLVRVLPEIEGPVVKTYCCLRKNLNPVTQKNLKIFEQFFSNYLKHLGIKLEYE